MRLHGAVQSRHGSRSRDSRLTPILCQSQSLLACLMGYPPVTHGKRVDDEANEPGRGSRASGGGPLV